MPKIVGNEVMTHEFILTMQQGVRSRPIASKAYPLHGEKTSYMNSWKHAKFVAIQLSSHSQSRLRVALRPERFHSRAVCSPQNGFMFL